ncbi:hypothetical protein CC85DRAFT_321104 [Cutaneotrichosporon oleaginosum]|uniref:Uncharacterized protein n=1 Tax=Cutaneotrichosporon oleaginosum TaxID=879819 RepID=A0A0J0XWY5_9TREE|nr:uncharacterized protein CC85DRAFT_321104 [Cutaneotrichosporon oleaginosum]KLT45558.1 hypothetical protein CC85DRAFT_321104 [Cutaneotrichosporon oleaginosum]TXT14488.1 hypothetical protein COLE_00681 [Cutaneotrichosporon oleaginosum]
MPRECGTKSEAADDVCRLTSCWQEMFGSAWRTAFSVSSSSVHSVMAALLRSWIESTIINHDAQYGADLGPFLTTPVLCQLIKFTTLRGSQADGQITAVISDQTHRVNVAFDQHAADSYELSKAGEEPERLTSLLRSVLRLRQYSITLLPPSYRNKHQIPRVLIVVHRWEVVTGDRQDPIYFPDAKHLGRGQTTQDEAVNRVLQKWWLGNSQKIQPSPISVERDPDDPGGKVVVEQRMTVANASAGPSRPRQVRLPLAKLTSELSQALRLVGGH